MIELLIKALRGLEPVPTAQELADAIWLAQCFEAAGGHTSDPADDSSGRLTGRSPALDTPEPQSSPDSADRPRQAQSTTSAPQAGLFVAGPDAEGDSLIRAPTVPAIRRGLPLTRALRPLRVTKPSRVQDDLDEDATAQQVAETGVWEPIMRPAPERWLDLAVVVDSGPSMAVWQQTVDELLLILQQLGAFRDIRSWRLDADGDRPQLRTGVTRSGRNPDELIDPTRRRIVLVVTDCVGPAWHDGRVAAVLERWGRAGPVAMVHLLPQRLWRRSPVALLPVRFEAPEPELPNSRLIVRTRGGDDAEAGPPPGIAIPVMELAPRWLRPWARMVGNGSRGVDGVALFTGRPTAETVDLTAEETVALTPVERVMRFRATASPEAFRLAGYLAAAPLRLPVMRLVQQAMLPQSTPAHLAEVFLGDLLRRAAPASASSGPGPKTGPNTGTDSDTEYEFRPGVRELLLSGLQRGEALRVLREVWEVVRGRLGSSTDFPALLDALEHDGTDLRSDRLFAQVAAQVLVRLGGRYSEIGRRLSVAAETHEGVRTRDGHIPGSGGAVSDSTPWSAAESEAGLDRSAVVASGPAVPDALQGGSAPQGGDASLDALRSEPSESPAEGGHRELWGELPPRNPNFTGREAILERIGQAINDTVTVLLPASQPGLGGEGKSQLAVEYALRHAGQYDLVWWVSAEQTTLARSSLAALSQKLGTSRSDDIMSRVESVLQVLRAGVAYPRWLLIYDNAGDPVDLVGLMPVTPRPPAGRLVTPAAFGHILVTSRDTRWSSLATTIEVDVFIREESIRFLLRRVPRLSEAEADLLARRVGDLPLAVEQVAAWHVATDGTAEDYLRQFDRRIEELAEQPQPSGGLPTRLVATLDLTFGRLREDAPEAGVLIELCAFFSPEPVAKELLGAGAHADLPAELRALLADEASLEQAMRDIRRFALARFDEDAATLQVHRLTRAMLQTRLTLEDRARIRGYVHRILVAATPRSPATDETTWPQRSRINPHVVPAEVVEGEDPYVRGVALDQMRYLWLSGDFEGSRLLAELAFDRWREMYGPDDESSLEAGRALGNALRSLGDIRRAAAVSGDTLERMNRVLGRDHLSTLYTESGYAADLRLRGAFLEAHELDLHAWRRMRARFGDDHDNTLPLANNVGLNLRLLGDFPRALEFDRDALRHLQRKYGDRHRSTLLAIDHLAQDLHGLGRYHEALQLQQGSLETRRKILGSGHLYVLNAAVNHTGTLRRCGRYSEAATLAAATLEAHRVRFGERHPETLTAERGLALATLALGTPEDAAEARRLSEQALAGYRQVLGDDHPFTQACAADLGIALRRLGEYQSALEIDEEALHAMVRLMGPDHHYALCCAVGVLNDLHLLGEFDAAHDRSVDTLERFRRVHGPTHPLTLVCAYDHRVLCDAMGRAVDPDAQDPVAGLRSALGRDHPEATRAARGELLDCEIEPTPL